MLLNRHYITISMLILGSVLTACAPVAPSLDKTKFMSSKKTPEAATGKAEKKQIITRVSGSQFELKRSWIEAKHLETALRNVEKSNAIAIHFRHNDGSLENLLGEGAEFTTKKLTTRKVRLVFVSKDLKSSKEVKPVTTDKAEKPQKPEKEEKKEEKKNPSQEFAEIPEFTVFSTSDSESSETRWWVGHDALTLEEEATPEFLEQVDSAVLVIYPVKSAKKKKDKEPEAFEASSPKN